MGVGLTMRAKEMPSNWGSRDFHFLEIFPGREMDETLRKVWHLSGQLSAQLSRNQKIWEDVKGKAEVFNVSTTTTFFLTIEHTCGVESRLSRTSAIYSLLAKFA